MLCSQTLPRPPSNMAAPADPAAPVPPTPAVPPTPPSVSGWAAPPALTFASALPPSLPSAPALPPEPALPPAAASGTFEPDGKQAPSTHLRPCVHSALVLHFGKQTLPAGEAKPSHSSAVAAADAHAADEPRLVQSVVCVHGMVHSPHRHVSPPPHSESDAQACSQLVFELPFLVSPAQAPARTSAAATASRLRTSPNGPNVDMRRFPLSERIQVEVRGAEVPCRSSPGRIAQKAPSARFGLVGPSSALDTICPT